MNENAVKIQIALSALEQVKVPATAENVNSLTVVWQMLQQVKESLAAVPVDGSGSAGAGNPGNMPVRQEIPDGVTVRFEEDEDGKPETE